MVWLGRHNPASTHPTDEGHAVTELEWERCIDRQIGWIRQFGEYVIPHFRAKEKVA